MVVPMRQRTGCGLVVVLNLQTTTKLLRRYVLEQVACAGAGATTVHAQNRP